MKTQVEDDAGMREGAGGAVVQLKPREGKMRGKVGRREWQRQDTKGSIRSTAYVRVRVPVHTMLRSMNGFAALGAVARH